MRFVLRQEDWVLDFLNTAEWFFIHELPSLASGDGFSDEVKKVLFPPPIVDREDKPVGSEETGDWEEFVRPDIEDSFARDRAVVSLDIEGALQTEDPLEWYEEDDEIPSPPPEGPMWRVVVDMEHTEQWYSTLNQTRILMNRAHGLAEDETRFLMSILGASDDATPERGLLLAQYEFYCVIQNILVENVMN